MHGCCSNTYVWADKDLSSGPELIASLLAAVVAATAGADDFDSSPHLADISQVLHCQVCGVAQAKGPLPARTTVVVYAEALNQARGRYGPSASFGKLLGNALLLDKPQCTQSAGEVALL